MPTECIPKQLEFQGHGFRKVVGDFSGGRITTDGGGLLLREVAIGTKLLERFADCFIDNRNQGLIEHTKLELLSQRIFGIALGYEDLNDHDDLRADTMLATLVGKIDPTGEQRSRKRDKGYPLAGKSKENPRFVVTSLSKAEYSAQELYEDLYCARGDMENRIKEQQLGLFADRTSSASFSANHLRLWFSGVAYVLMTELRRVGLKGTEFAQAQCSTIRTKLLKVGALISLSVRRIWVRYATGYPYQRIFATILQNLRIHYMSLQI